MKKLILKLLMLSSIGAFAQNKMAVLDIQTENLSISPSQMGSLVRLEIEKIGKYEVMDKYDIEYLAQKNNISTTDCYGKTCLLEKGKILGADFMIGGAVTNYSEVLVVNLKLIDVSTGEIQKSYIKEFNVPTNQLKPIIELSIRNMFDLSVDQDLLNQLSSNSNFENTLTNPYSDRLKLSGPRMGFTYFTGTTGKIIRDSKNNGGYDALPVLFQFGYQFETQYLNEGNYQGLFEFIPAITGMDQGMLVPSFTIVNGLRNNKTGWEFALGPTFSITRVGNGYYDKDGNWVRLSDKGAYPTDAFIEQRLDSQGSDVQLHTGFLIAVGKSFRSGKLNIPVNMYMIPSKSGFRLGASFGFNGRIAE